MGDASAASIPSDDVTERQGRGLCRLKLSIIDTGFNYLIVSPVHACVSYLRDRDSFLPTLDHCSSPEASIK